MNTSRSSDINCTTAFKALQLQFINWTARWANTADKIEQHPIDLPDLVQLLQALGFHIRRMDGYLPEETCPLRDNEKGIRVIVTCNHSGHRCYLEQPLNADQCKCMKVPNDSSKDGFWEIVATKPSLNQSASTVETGSDLIPPLSKELKQIIYSVANYLIHMMHSSNISKNASQGSSEIEHVPKRYSDQYYSIQRPAQHSTANVGSSMYDFTKNPNVIVSSPHKGIDSPTRYRSLDTLTSKGADSGFPEPGSLTAIYSISESETSALSSPNIHLTADDVDGDSKSTIEDSGKALSLMKSAFRNLGDAISLIEANNANISTESVFEKQPKRNIKISKNAVSSPGGSPLTTRAASSPNLSKSSKSLSIKNTKSPKFPSKSASSACVKSASKARKPTENKIELKKSGSTSSVGDGKPKIPQKADLQGQAIKRTSSLYAHIKSTIPKPSSSKKK